MMDLTETATLMQSKDYKDRFAAEYWQVRIRAHKLDRMLGKWERGLLDFDPACSKALLEVQLDIMREYMGILEQRARIEGIDLGKCSPTFSAAPRGAYKHIEE